MAHLRERDRSINAYIITESSNIFSSAALYSSLVQSVHEMKRCLSVSLACRSKGDLKTLDSHLPGFPRPSRVSPGTTWMGGLQRKVGTHRKWGDDSIGGILPLSQVWSQWPWSGNWPSEAKTELRSETKILLTKEPTQEVNFWVPAEFKPQTWALFSVPGRAGGCCSDFPPTASETLWRKEEPRCRAEFCGKGE